VKRVIDLVLVLVFAPIVLPVLAVCALAVWVGIGRPVFFSQMRAGRDGRPFRMFKFRSMTDARDAAGQLLPDELRLTPFTRRLRALSLDELPELLNVIAGDMSLVGPRPWLLDYVPLYSVEQRRRLAVPPGITGWAQVNGRNALSWEERFTLDIWYVDHQSLFLDLKILVQTVWRVARRDDISYPGHATMPVFRGRSDAHD